MEALARFAEAHGIEFPLLSDKGSRVIRELGILNTLIMPDEPVYGIPLPGSYLVDEQGLVLAKLFHRQYQVRDTSATILHSGFHVPLDHGRLPDAKADLSGVRLTAALGATTLRPMQQADLYLRLSLEDGLHIYGRPIPDGYYPLEVEVRGPEGLRVGQPQYPPTKPFRIEGLNEQFQVFEGEVEIVVPLVSAVREGDSVPLEIAVRYQACNDRECFPPRMERLHLDVPRGRLNSPQRP